MSGPTMLPADFLRFLRENPTRQVGGGVTTCPIALWLNSHRCRTYDVGICDIGVDGAHRSAPPWMMGFVHMFDGWKHARGGKAVETTTGDVLRWIHGL